MKCTCGNFSPCAACAFSHQEARSSWSCHPHVPFNHVGSAQDSKHGSVGIDWQLSIKLRILYLNTDNCHFKKNIQQKLANLSMYCVKRTYAMHAASSERKCTWGFKMNVFMAVLLFFDSTATLSQRISQPTHHYWLWRAAFDSPEFNIPLNT